MNLKQLEAFICVADMNNFSKAAKKLYLTQPTISAHITSLERELGCRLFVRTTKDVVLSPAGELLYDNAKRMLQLEKNIIHDFAQRGTRAMEKITVGASTVPGQYILPKVLSLFAKAYPGKRLELREADSMDVVNMVMDGHVEIGFTGTKIQDPCLVFEPFFQDRMYIITPNTEEYQRYQEAGFPLERLYGEKWVVREEGSGTRREKERRLANIGVDIGMLNVVATISNQETIKKSVSGGMGIAIMSGVAVEDYVNQGALLRFPLSEGDITRDLHMVWSKSNKPGQAARLFIQFVREAYAGL